MEKRLWLMMPKLTDDFIHATISQSEDPIGVERFNFDHHENGMKIINKTAAFGTIMIIYESDLMLQLKLVESLLNPK
jgi:glutamate-5-semialdehyde dehydrogenase